jgi:hypothetical protein
MLLLDFLISINSMCSSLWSCPVQLSEDEGC